MTSRSKQIIDYLTTHNLVTVNELVTLTKASPATIRRDLVSLSAKGSIYRVHGGVTLNRMNQMQPTIEEKTGQHHLEKVQIGRAGAALIKSGNSVVLDAGTTSIEVARAITSDQVSIITSDLSIGMFLASNKSVSVSVTGGTVDWSSKSCIGSESCSLMQRIHPDYTFIACNAFDIEFGITAPTLEKANFKAALLSQNSKRILIADSSKYGKSQLFEAGSLTMLDLIITDQGLPQLEAEKIESLGVKVLRVPT